ncbi:hypothetical protein RF11_13743 [Thelohanellus kitauei]|uniref:Uncharacterized protein n=1 Tax=Thelohanellus kitauei TaxID=669202 RepID=A0A0C2J6I7_THEKT|nr:hypothetical protein RF11_13743 [Thelohanellus kitauei]
MNYWLKVINEMEEGISHERSTNRRRGKRPSKASDFSPKKSNGEVRAHVDKDSSLTTDPGSPLGVLKSGRCGIDHTTGLHWIIGPDVERFIAQNKDELFRLGFKFLDESRHTTQSVIQRSVTIPSLLARRYGNYHMIPGYYGVEPEPSGTNISWSNFQSNNIICEKDEGLPKATHLNPFASSNNSEAIPIDLDHINQVDQPIPHPLELKQDCFNHG